VPFGITPLHVIVVLVIALIILGPRMLPRVGSAVGRSIREFRQAVPATRDAFVSEVKPPSAPGPGPGGGAAAGAKAGTVVGRSVRELREALTGARDAFQSEVGSSPAAGAPAPTATALRASSVSETNASAPRT
jgi:sec-independent protein translocase protein TatA